MVSLNSSNHNSHKKWKDSLEGSLGRVLLAVELSHKKWKDSLEGSLGRVLLAVELEFPKILVPESQNGQNNSILYM